MTSKVDIIKNLANKLNLIDNNDLKGGESNDLDSLIELAYRSRFSKSIILPRWWW